MSLGPRRSRRDGHGGLPMTASAVIISFLLGALQLFRGFARINLWHVKRVQQVQELFRWGLLRHQLTSKGFPNFGSDGPVVEAVRKIVGSLFWCLGALGTASSSDLLLKFARLGEMPRSGVTQEIGGKGVAHVPRHFKAAFGLVAMMTRIVHRAIHPQLFVLIFV